MLSRLATSESYSTVRSAAHQIFVAECTSGRSLWHFLEVDQSAVPRAEERYAEET